jgi:curved DNA-binding protein CbpA
LDSKGYYAILEVSEHANYQDIKRAYRRLARKYHPDRNNSSFAEDMIKKINASFEVLSDKDKRQEYDKIGFNTILFEEDDAKKNNNNIHEQVQHDPSYNNNDYTSRSDNIYSDYGHNNNYYASRKPQKDNGNNRIDARTPTVLTDLDTPKARFHIIVEPSLCMAFGSCETLAPKVFVVEKNKRINPKARIESETGANLETILAAAQTCPTKAIRIIDRYTGEQIYP